MATTIIIILLFAIIVALGAAGVYLIKGGDDDRRTLYALTLRIVLSVALIVFLIVAFTLGWIHPHGISGH